MSARPKVFVVGSFNMDLSVRAPRMPTPGETILGGPFMTGPGGKGGNQAVAAARLGADVWMLAKLGRDGFGDQAQANLTREGIRPDFILRSDEAATGVAIIVVDESGENMIVVAGGANGRLTPADVEAARTAITSADALLVQLEVPIETVERACQIAHAAGVKVLLNPAPGRLLSHELLANVDVLTPNETEAALITGLPVGGAEAAEAAAFKLIASGVGAVVETLGSKGALTVTAGGAQRIQGRKVKVVDSTGAGDAFNGALAVALAEGKSIQDAVVFANAAAAIQVTRAGTAAAMPTCAEVEAFLAG
jgi:ribokinase